MSLNTDSPREEQQSTLRLQVSIETQPSPTSCGPTCLQAVYRYHGLETSVHQLIREIPELETGGTLAVHLGLHALRHGFRAVLYSYNFRIFDPTWFRVSGRSKANFRAGLAAQTSLPRGRKTRLAAAAYLDFHDRGGEIRFKDLSSALIRSILCNEGPLLTGLSATYLYQTAREIPETNVEDSLTGSPVGHFVVLAGYDRATKRVLVADPYGQHPLGEGRFYQAPMTRILGSILLGVLTYDANLLIITPR